MQEGAAAGLEKADENKYFEKQIAEYQERRDVLSSYLDQLGLPVCVPQGAYFTLMDVSRVKLPEENEYPYSPTVLGRGRVSEISVWRISDRVLNQFGILLLPTGLQNGMVVSSGIQGCQHPSLGILQR